MIIAVILTWITDMFEQFRQDRKHLFVVAFMPIPTINQKPLIFGKQNLKKYRYARSN